MPACHAFYRPATIGSTTVNRRVHLQKTLLGRVKELEAQLADVAKQRDKDLNELQARVSSYQFDNQHIVVLMCST